VFLTQNAGDQCFKFQILLILQYLHIHNEISEGRESSLNMKFIYTPHAPYTNNLRVLPNSVFSAPSHEVRCVIFHLWHHEVLRIFQTRAFWSVNFRLGMFNLYLLSLLQWSFSGKQPLSSFASSPLQTCRMSPWGSLRWVNLIFSPSCNQAFSQSFYQELHL
jgi:hypothetical protein